MKNSKKAWIVFRRTTIILFIIFLINYYQVESGNYISEENKRAILTEEKIEEFETDVKNGDFVDIKDYVQDNLGYEIGEGVNDFINNKVVKFFNYIGGFFK